MPSAYVTIDAMGFGILGASELWSADGPRASPWRRPGRRTRRGPARLGGVRGGLRTRRGGVPWGGRRPGPPGRRTRRLEDRDAYDRKADRRYGDQPFDL